MSTYHAFGKRIDGVLHYIFGAGFHDQAFFAFTDAFPLPAGWVAWHVDYQELSDPPSERVKELRAMPCVYPTPGLPWWEAYWKDLVRDGCDPQRRDEFVSLVTSKKPA